MRKGRLTRREGSLVRLVADGMCTLQLRLTEHTVRNHPIRIFDKVASSSRVELVLYAFSGMEGNAAPENPKTFSASAEQLHRRTRIITWRP